MKNTFKNEVFQNLPPELKVLTDNFQERERDIVLLSTLGAVSSILPNLRVDYRGDEYGANLFIMILAPPASGKGKMNLALKLVDPIHKRLIELKEVSTDKNYSKQKLKIVPGNVTCSKLYKHLSQSPDGVLIFESEADSISSMINQEWGNFSDVLRKAFHHEKISMSRSTDDVFFEVDSPYLSLVTSGTPGQLKPLIKSKENGLFSRMTYYYFDEKSYWKSSYMISDQGEVNQVLTQLGLKLYNLYGILKDKEIQVVSLSENQKKLIDTSIGEIHDSFVNIGEENFTSSVKRHGVIITRMILIFTVIRNIDSSIDNMVVSDEDVTIALELGKTLIVHALNVYQLFESDSILLPENESKILNSLNDKFLRRDVITIAENLDVAERTADEYLRRWISNKLIRRISKGNYKKVNLEVASVANIAGLADRT